MRRGRKATPTVLRLLRNNPGKRKIDPDEPEPRVLVPAPPKTVQGAAREEWKRTVPELERLGLITVLDLPAFTSYCQAWGRYVDAEEKIAVLGEVVKTPSGYPIQNPYRAVANKALADCRWFWENFGMNPSARTRVRGSKAAGAAPASKVDQFMRRLK